VFTDDFVQVTVDKIAWEPVANFNGTTIDASFPLIRWTTFVNGEALARGNYSLTEAGRILPSSLTVGTVPINARGKVTVRVVLELDGAETTTERTIQSFGSGVAIIPLLLVLVMSLTTHMVEFSLFTCVFVGSCIVEGEVIDGFKRTLDKYLLVRDGPTKSKQLDDSRADGFSPPLFRVLCLMKTMSISSCLRCFSLEWLA
jgi:hypothetical protein